MKAPLFLLLASAPLAEAALIARVATDRGTVAVELQHDSAPQAVANFITLAQGTRNRVNPLSGAVTNAPLYIGEKFFRTSNNASVKFAQTGSGTGTNAGSSGFTFRDEFTPAVRHTGYTLSSANAGLNTNGGQIFFTGNVTIPQYDDVHSIIGLVPSPASRAVVDAIITAGDNATTITGITFERTDPAAVAFNEHAQNLPTVTRPGGKLRVSPGSSVVWDFLPIVGTGSIFRVFRSPSLATSSWSESPQYRIHAGIGSPISNPFIDAAYIDDGSSARAFYNLSVASHPGAVAPSHLRNRTVSIPLSGGVLTFAFTSAGDEGTTTYTPNSGPPVISSFELLDFRTGAHDVFFLADNEELIPRYIRSNLGCNSATSTSVVCRHKTEYFNEFFGWLPYSPGTATITR